MVQPPLPHIDEVTVATEEWQHTPLKVTMKGAKVTYMSPDLDGGKAFADGVGFPNVGPRVGVYSADAIVDFMVPSQPKVRLLHSSKKAD